MRSVLFSLLAGSLLFSSLLQGQTGTGTVTGTVTDPSAAVLPQTKITLTNENTGVTLSSVSNAAGIYYFASVQAGPYRLTAEAAGFRRWTGTLTLQVGQTATIDPKMAVGAVETAVEVTDAAPVITVEGMNISDVKDALRIRQLPLNGRAISNLFALTPGVESGSAPRVNGLKVGSVELLLDGVSLNDRFGGGFPFGGHGQGRVSPLSPTAWLLRIKDFRQLFCCPTSYTWLTMRVTL